MNKTACLVCTCFLGLSQATVAGTVEVYRSSFEGTNGGWNADATWDPIGDWQRGVPHPGPAPLPAPCSLNAVGPAVAYDGAECWGTKLNACYTNANGTSFLRQTFDFTTVIHGTLSWREYRHIIASLGNDRGRLRINGDMVYEVPFDNLPSDGWEPQSVDLTPYGGLASVEIVFEFFATSSINAPGWYIDDVRITSLVDPNPGDVGVLLEDTPDPIVNVGDPVVYTITVINHSNASASDVAVNGTLDASLVFNAALSDPAVTHDGSGSGGSFSIAVGSMPPFSVQVFEVGANTTQLGSVSTSVNASADESDPNLANNSAVQKTEVALITDIAVALGSDQSPVITLMGYSYLLNVGNLGPSNASSVAWSLALPTGVTFLSSSDGVHDGSPTGGMVTGKLPALLAGANEIVTVNVRPNASSPSELTASASASVTSPDETDPDASNNEASLILRHVPSAEPFSRVLFATGGMEDFVVGKPLPTAHPPGLPDRRYGFFDKPYVSPNGQTWGVHAFLEFNTTPPTPNNDEVVVIVSPTGAETAVYEGVTPVPGGTESVSSIHPKLSVNDAGCYTLRADASTSRHDIILRGCGANAAGAGSLAVVARQGQPIPGDPLGRNYSFLLREAQLDNNGVVRFMGRALQADQTTDDMILETPNDGASVSVLLREAVSIPTGQAGGATNPWDEWKNEFQDRTGQYVSGDGLTTLLRGDTTAATTSDDVLTLNNHVVLQEGQVLADFVTSISDPARGMYLAPNGDWYARGTNIDGTEWVVRNGEIIARSGDPVFPGSDIRWASNDTTFAVFHVVAGDVNGNYVIGGQIVDPAAPSETSAGFTPPPEALVLNGEIILVRTGDPIDIDGNGLFDHNPTIFQFDPDGAVFLADGTLVFGAFVAVPLDVAAATATTTTTSDPVIANIKVLNLSGACCLGGVVCFDDVLEFDCAKSGGQHFAGRRCADVPCGLGACCVVQYGGAVAGDPTGVRCEETTAAECLSDSLNEYKGDGTRCEEVTCGGACCIEEPPPSVVAGVPFDPCLQAFTRPDCETFPGDYQGDGTVCGGVLCNFCASDADCDDGDQCNGQERCILPSVAGGGGYCVNGVPPEIDDGVDCTIDECDPATGNVTHTPNNAACDDGDPCNGREVCNPKLGCVPGTPPTCDDSIDCTNDSCDKNHPSADPKTGCVNVKNDAKCVSPIDCVTGRCLALESGSGCVFSTDDTRCLDENRCTTNERCDINLGCLSDPVNCDDGKSCTIDTCDPVVGCLNGADHTRCNDGVDCTVDLCRPANPASDPVTGCLSTPDDGLCPTTDLCVPRRCDLTRGCQDEPRECPSDGDPCTREFCDPGTGECVQETICGACCREGQPCIDRVTVAQCSGPDDTFMGLGTTCETAPCGACCDPDTGACADGVTELACAQARKIFHGPGSNCAQETCTGACCDPGFNDGACYDNRTAEECAAIDDDAIFMGVDTDCDSVPCGACCDPATSDRPQSCLDAATAEFCEALKFVYAGDQTLCANDPCRGACCLSDGRCIVTAPEDCAGDFRGNGTACDELNPPCEPFTGGACCLEDGLCFDGATRETCVGSLFGVYQGDGVLCASVLCPVNGVSPADINEDGDVDMLDVAIINNFFGRSVKPGSPGERADIDGNGRVDDDDWALFARGLTGPR